MKEQETLYGLLLHKDEYNAAFVAWLKKNFQYEEETAKQLYIYGTKEELDKVMSLMYKSAESCSIVFPKFNTIEDEYEELVKVFQKATMEITDAYLHFAASPAFVGGELMNAKEQNIRSQMGDMLLQMRDLMNRVKA